MRLVSALKTDTRFQFKQGFYAVYILLTIMYLIIIQKIPEGLIRDYAVPVIIFFDPSFVGFFFIGGIVMLEKQQGVIDLLSVTPLSPTEYLMSKSVSLGVLAVFASLIIAVAAHRGNFNLGLFMVSIFLTSVFFTLYGFIVAAGCRTINQYFIKMIPYMLLAMIPCFAVIDFNYSWLLRVLPSAAGLMLTIGVFRGIPAYEAALYIVFMCIWNILIFWAALKTYDKKVLSGGDAV